MSTFFFSGSFEGKLDNKNRFVLPKPMRYGLVEEGKLEFIIGLGLGGCLAIYRRSDIQKIVEKFQESLYVAKYQKFFTLFFSTLHHTSCDNIGRTLIPGHLKEMVRIEREILVAGVLNKIEIWPREIYDKNLKEVLTGQEKEFSLAQMMEDAFALLHEKKET